ncbi:hypothetical protein R8Z50_22465 [Longispora sp. K20-0274]|uniref:hypothetical protein n=1 Tax=Longispora sp. K20-0274 TaxID=3088255 RepID=UPI00399B2B5C
MVRDLLHDDTDDPQTRLAGLLVLLYGQHISRGSRLRLDQITTTLTTTTLALGAHPIELPALVAALVTTVAANRLGWWAVGRVPNQHWLFPGARAGQPISPATLGRHLREAGIPVRAGRNTALMHLAAELPAVVLAKLLDLNLSTAVTWAAIAGNTRPNYAAALARRRT